MFKNVATIVVYVAKAFVIASLLIPSSCSVSANNNYEAHINNLFKDLYTNFDIYIPKSGFQRIRQLIFHRNENFFYFTFDGAGEAPSRHLGYIDIVNRIVGLIQGIRNPTCLAIDDSYTDVYISGSHGLYLLNRTERPERLLAEYNIQSLYYKDVLYYTNSRNEVYIYDSGDTMAVEELEGQQCENIIVDDDDNIFCMQGQVLIQFKLNTKMVYVHKHKLNVWSVDTHQNHYISTNVGVYMFNKTNNNFDKLYNNYNYGFDKKYLKSTIINETNMVVCYKCWILARCVKPNYYIFFRIKMISVT